MATTAALILAFVNNRLQEAFASGGVNDEILATFNDLTKFNLLKVTTPESASGVDGTTSISVPSDFKMIISITPTDAGSVQKLPLLPIPGGFKEYKKWISDASSNFRSTPTHYTRHAGKFFLWPTLNASFTFKIEYYKHHAQGSAGIAAIEFDDTFTNALNFGATYYAALFRKKTSYVNRWRPIYHEERALMIQLNPPEPSVVGS